MRVIVAAVSLSATSASLLRVNLNRTENGHILGYPMGSEKPKFGHEKCQCVGIDNIEGTTETTAGPYPADLGARCEAWDKDQHADCKSANPPKWCADAWCYVDPCKCDIEVMPKVSSYLPDAQYQGKSVYYSYASCGSTDQWTSENADKACVNQKDAASCKGLSRCAWSDEHKKCGGKELMGVCNKPIQDFKWGQPECRCIGIDGQGGTTKMKLGEGKFKDYPADTGATCEAWDKTNHPDCAGPNAPEWCIHRWCFVDPCSCELDQGDGSSSPPKSSYYLPEATFQGKPLFYSYNTCGGQDVYADEEKIKKAAQKQDEVCSSAWAASPFVGLLLAFMTI